MSKTIWVIEDDCAIAEAIEIILMEEGFEVSCFQNGEILEQPVASFPDLILLDHYLQDENGGNLCHKIKANAKTAHLPVLILSGHAKVKEIALKCGADGYIEKPFDLADFVGKIRMHLANSVTQN